MLEELTPKELLARLRAKRAYQNKSQEQIADKIGKARTTYRAKEDGQKEFKLSEFAKTAIELDFNAQEIGEMIMLYKN